jgi:dTDP-4-dehydrorhamnose reductase
VGYTSLDVTDFRRVKEVIEDFAPHVIINCAALTRVDACETERELCWKVNVESVENLVRLCRNTGCRLIQLSTDFIFDGREGPYREDARPNPVNFYGKSKLAAENAVRQLGPDKWSIARTVMVYGTGTALRHENIALWMLNRLSRGSDIHVYMDQYRSPTYVIDLAQGIERLVRYNRSGVYHLSGRECVSIHDFAVEIAREFGFDTALIKPVSSNEMVRPAQRPLRTGFIILKAETELGFRPRPLRESLADLKSRIDLSVFQSS